MSAVPPDKLQHVCPACGAVPTLSQYVFYPKFFKVRCRGCRAELKYVFPLWKKIVLGVVGGILGIVGVLAAVVLEVTHGLPFVPVAVANVLLLSLSIGYFEAWHVRRRYPLVQA